MDDIHIGSLLNAILFASSGLLLFGAAFLAVQKLSPFDLWKEILENRNVALAVLLAGIAVAMGLIVSSAVH
jgi:putative membrane protein